nr:terminase small subunit [uncultured Cohaesibacter sp.]
MAAPKGNKFWQARSRHGRKPKWEDPNELWEACEEYFEWVEGNPLLAAELVKYKGKFKTAKVAKMRAMTISGLCIFLGIDVRTWPSYREKEGFIPVVTRVEEIIREQKFTGAAAGLLETNIIARDLGLIDKTEQKHGVSDDLKEMFDRIDGASKGLAGLRGKAEESEMEAEQPLLDRG